MSPLVMLLLVLFTFNYENLNFGSAVACQKQFVTNAFREAGALEMCYSGFLLLKTNGKSFHQ